ncbi:MAG: hypothetical protein GXN93_02130 [Candidatus Diapherotrites archaeon]|nr:hypothetical protein [Candidatus Diapherotrites archaeon]
MRYWSVFVALLTTLSAAFAVQMYYPVAHVFANGESYSIGTIAPGHTLSIIIDRGNPQDPWIGVKLDKNWNYRYDISGNNMYIYITIPKNVKNGPSQVCITAYGQNSAETFCPSFLIANGLISAEIGRKTVIAPAGEQAKIPVLIQSKSIGETDVSINCSMGKPYCAESTTHIGTEKAKIVNYSASYPFPGTYPTTLTITDMGSGDEIQKTVTLVFTPSIRNDMGALHWGLPISAPILQPIMNLLALVTGK